MTSHEDSARVVGEPDEWAKAAGRRVRRERTRRGMSQADLAAASGVGVRTISSMENATGNVRLPNWHSVLAVLGVDPSRITYDGEPAGDIPRQANNGADLVRNWIAARPTDKDRDEALFYLMRAIGKYHADD